MVNTVKSGLIISLLSLTATAAIGDDHTGKIHPADSNQDGILELAEMKAVQLARFSRMDSDSDGYLALDELPKTIKMPDRPGRSHRPPRGAGSDKDMRKMGFEDRWPRMLERLQEKGLSDEEIVARKDKMQARFEERDARRAERRSARREGGISRLSFIGRLDKDGDERVSEAEFLRPGERRFRRIDSNGDGRITADERPNRGARKGTKS